MRISAEKHLTEHLQLVFSLRGKVSSSYTMPHLGLWDDAASFGAFPDTFAFPPRSRLFTRHTPHATHHSPLPADSALASLAPGQLPTPHWPPATYRRASSGQVVRRPSPLATASHPPPNPHELQDPILYFRTLPSATASSRGVGEPGTGAKVAKDRTRPDHGDQALSYFQRPKTRLGLPIFTLATDRAPESCVVIVVMSSLRF